MNPDEIHAVFSNLGISLIDQGKEQVLEAKRRWGRDVDYQGSESHYHVIVSNGTGQKNIGNAKLERRSY